MKKIKLSSIRMGYAHNSSSTHSIVVLPEENAENLNDIHDMEFGWDYFTAGAADQKLAYLQMILSSSFNEDFAEALVGLPKEELGYIDHDSYFGIPSDFSGKKSVDFAKALIEFFQKEDVVILGGNDNDDYEHHLLEGAKAVLPTHRMRSGTRVRYDAKSKYWTMFVESPYDERAAKVRLSLEEGETIIPAKADRPELVDVKITDYCAYGCDYCYMGSTREGQHASMEYLTAVADALQEMEVFEVALGGGEPTTHPQFIEILKMFRERGVIPNFTTRNKKLLSDSKLREEVDKYCGSFAFSVDNAKALKKIVPVEPEGCPNWDDFDDYKKYREATDKFKSTAAYKNYDRKRKFNPPNIQVVIGTVSNKDLKQIFKICADEWVGLTLLGYKTTGRGGLCVVKTNDNWVTMYRKAKENHEAPDSIGIDTVLAQQIQKDLVKMGIPEETYELEEGKFSMYIDAVAQRMGKCSYVLEDEYEPLPLKDNLVEDILTAFEKY